jgi:hypothetical protein
MKKFLVSLAAIVLVGFIIVSCEKDEDFDESLLIGKWQYERLFERYFANGTGYSWDEGQDVREEEAQHFDWTLEGSELTRYERMEISGLKITYRYTVTELTSSRLRYRDHFMKGYSFIRVND